MDQEHQRGSNGPLEEELLPDPFNERVKTVHRPPNKRLKVSRLYPDD